VAGWVVVGAVVVGAVDVVVAVVVVALVVLAGEVGSAVTGDSPLHAASVRAGTTTATAQSCRRRVREVVEGASEDRVKVFISRPA
jgi:hypothetical protein